MGDCALGVRAAIDSRHGALLHGLTLAVGGRVIQAAEAIRHKKSLDVANEGPAA